MQLFFPILILFIALWNRFLKTIENFNANSIILGLISSHKAYLNVISFATRHISYYHSMPLAIFQYLSLSFTIL